MSVEAISWALAQKLDRSSAKFVLVAMANCANADMTCWPSMQYLSDATCQDRKTVIENIRRLKADGFISDTDDRKGRTSQVAVYVLNSTENGPVEEARKRNSTENGTVPKTEAKSPVFPVKESRFSVERVPKTGHGTIREPSIEPSGKQKKAQALSKFPELDGIDPQIVADWKALRLAKRAPVTATAIVGIQREAAKAEMTLAEALAMACERGWAGFKAEWLSDRGGGGKQSALEARNKAVADIFRGAR